MGALAYQTVSRDFFSAYPGSAWKDIFFLILLLFLLAAGLAFLWVYAGHMKRTSLRKIFLGYANLWNSRLLSEAGRRAPALMTEELLRSRKGDDVSAVDCARMILDFFSHIGRQVRQAVIPFSTVYFLYGREFLDLWEKRNFRIMSGKRGASGTLDAELEYLASLSAARRERDRTDPAGIISRSGDSFFSVRLAVLSFFTLVSLLVFLFSFFLYIRS